MMQSNQAFPLALLPARVANALVAEFNGRHPTVQEIIELSDNRLLATPGISHVSLKLIRSITHHPDDRPLPRLSDRELQTRLSRLQGEVRRLKDDIAARIGGASTAAALIAYQSGWIWTSSTTAFAWGS